MNKKKIRKIILISVLTILYISTFAIRISEKTKWIFCGISAVWFLGSAAIVKSTDIICKYSLKRSKKPHYFSDAEKAIISDFMSGEREKRGKAFVLKWADGGEVVARYEHCLEDYNEYLADDERFEEYWVLVFTLIHKAHETENIKAENGGEFHITYKNFPTELSRGVEG